jgi:uncharacterized membrane protein
VLGRDNRIADIAALNSLLTGATFFASTSLLILGGLGAMLGTTDRVIDVAADIPFARRESALVWLVKIILLIAVFVNALFQIHLVDPAVQFLRRADWRRPADGSTRRA